jgi:hypothetical protein
VLKYDGARAAKEPFLLPVELASTEMQNDYLSVRIRVPAQSAAAITAIKPGEWVTMTTRHRPAGDGEAVVSVRHYNAPETTE